MFCFALFLRQALSVPYAGLSHLWVSGLQWNIPNSTTYLGRPKSPSCPSVPGSEIGTQARLQSSRRLRTEQERRCSSPSTIGHRSQSTCFWLHRAGGSWPGVSHHLVSRDGDSAVEVALPRAAGPLGKEPSGGPGETFWLLRLCKKLLCISLLKTGLNDVQKAYCRRSLYIL